MISIKKIKRKVKELPDPAFAVILNSYRIISPWRNVFPVKISCNGCWMQLSLNEIYYTVNQNSIRGSKKYQRQKINKYTQSGFVEVESGDTVVDVGAFLGEFAVPASKIASVIAVEPDPITAKCLQKNTDNSSVTVVQCLLSDENSNIKFMRGDDPTESSIINIDKGGHEEITVSTKTLDDLMTEMEIKTIDFLKMDAEGAEPEVLRGIKDINVKKMAIDVGKERNGEKTLDEIKEILKSREYDIRIDSSSPAVIFARK